MGPKLVRYKKDPFVRDYGKMYAELQNKVFFSEKFEDNK